MEDKIGTTPEDIGINENFLTELNGTGNNTVNQQMGAYQIKTLCSVKETINRVGQKIIFASYSQNRGLTSRLYSNF